MLICTVYDSKASDVSPLFCAFDVEHAKRTFVCSLSETSPCVLYPKDYDLRIIGELDTEFAEIHSYPRYTSTDDDECKYKVIPVMMLIPDKYKKYCLDGTFESQK